MEHEAQRFMGLENEARMLKKPSESNEQQIRALQDANRDAQARGDLSGSVKGWNAKGNPRGVTIPQPAARKEYLQSAS
eukprot:547144-Karenia_brevis.AAC.1